MTAASTPREVIARAARTFEDEDLTLYLARADVILFALAEAGYEVARLESVAAVVDEDGDIATIEDARSDAHYRRRHLPDEPAPTWQALYRKLLPQEEEA